MLPINALDRTERKTPFAVSKTMKTGAANRASE
jgi:hypothetical protein